MRGRCGRIARGTTDSLCVCACLWACVFQVIGANFAVEYSLDEPVVDDQYLEEELDFIEAHRLAMLHGTTEPRLTPLTKAAEGAATAGAKPETAKKPPLSRPTVVTHAEDSKDVFGGVDTTQTGNPSTNSGAPGTDMLPPEKTPVGALSSPMKCVCVAACRRLWVLV